MEDVADKLHFKDKNYQTKPLLIEESKKFVNVGNTSKKGSPSSRAQRYNVSLRFLIPFRPFSKLESHPNDRAGLFSILTFAWLSGLIWKIYKKPPTIDDLWKISPYDKTSCNYKRLSRLWKNEVKLKGIKNASLHRVVWQFVSTRIILSGICFIVFGIALFISSSIIIQQLIHYISKENESTSLGYILIASLLGAEITRGCMLSSFFLLNYRTAIRTRAAVLLLIFKKILKMPSTSEKTTIGELITMCSNDGDRIFEGLRSGNSIILGPLLFITGTIYTWFMFGPVSLIGSFVFIFFIPLQIILIKVMNNLRTKSIIHSESRIRKINEILSSIKIVKMFSWECHFSKMINIIRNKELSILRMSALLGSINISIAFLSPVFASVLMICAYVLLQNPLTPELAFTVIAIYNVIANSLKFMPIAAKGLTEMNVSLSRFKFILALDGLHQYVMDHTNNKENAIEINMACFVWNCIKIENNKCLESDLTAHLIQEDNKGLSEAILKDVNLVVKKGNLVGITGAVGSGKTSLVAGILGHMSLISGSVAVDGSVAYCAQQAWLMNSTIRENILFGSVYDKLKYQDVVKSCELLKDFELFQSGDLTEVGERGINLSGGQKQRISLARALYSDKEIYLLDDPLSALDAHVAKNIFNEVILRQLKKNGKTILLVTHQTQYFSYCDNALFIENCSIFPYTSPTFSSKNILGISTDKTSSSIFQASTTLHPIPKVEHSDILSDELDLLMQGKLMTAEESGGVVPVKTFLTYMKSCGGYLFTFLLILFFIVNVGVQQFSTFWLSYWLKSTMQDATNHTTKNDNASFVLENFTYSFQSFNNNFAYNLIMKPDAYYYLTIYGLSAIVMLVVSVVRGYVFIAMTIQASHVLHSSLFNSILHGNINFFDTTPIGRILNRFQKDTDEQDVMLVALLEMLLFNICSLLVAMGIVSYVFPKFLLALAIILPFFLIIYIIFKPSAREMRRLDVLTRSPWFAHISTAVSGLDTIRTYKRVPFFVQKFSELLDENGVPCYLFVCVNRWLAFRLDMLTVCATIFIAVLVVFNKGFVSPAYAGLALGSSFLIGGMLQFTVRLIIETEARFVCIDRIKFYINNTPQEYSRESVKPPANWPNEGKIEFKNVNFQYRKGLPLALKNLSFIFKPAEKIGIVGRTGSGKSTLSVALFRLIEINSGRILIDDLDVSNLSLHDLRMHISIIPQDPIIFSGTVRYNLDPFDQFNDDEIWQVLEQVHLKQTINNLSGHLNGEVIENGNNFSSGERQLLCLARVLLQKAKILILDEATSAVDTETENIVHSVIDVVFRNSTVVTIAHRLSTILNSDRVVVLKEGEIAEFDKPHVLLQDQNSLFYKMNNSFATLSEQN